MRRSKSFSCSQPGVGVITGRYIQPAPIRNATAAGNVATLCTSRGRQTALKAISVGQWHRLGGDVGGGHERVVQRLQTTSSRGPVTVPWDTRSVINGTHTLTATASPSS